MTAYPYHPQLGKPGGLHSLDFSDPRLAPMIRVMLHNLRIAVRAWTPPPGMIRRKCSCQSGESAEIEYFVVEPEGAVGQRLPGILYCHGGGFFLPLQPMMLALAAQYAKKLHLRVFLPEYRLLPAAPAPAAFEDCLALWRQMGMQAGALGLDANRLLLYGESAGGTLAAGLCQYLRADGGAAAQPAGQLLVYPALDDRCSRYPSMERYADAPWPRRANETMWQEYLRGVPAPAAPLVPLRAMPAALQGLPPAYIEPQEFDILHDEAVAYGAALEAAGVAVEVNEVAGAYHGFDTDPQNPFVQTVVSQRIRAMEAMLAQ